MENEEQNINNLTNENIDADKLETSDSEINTENANSTTTSNGRKYTPAEQAYLDENPVVYKQHTSMVEVFFKNLKYRLSYTPALVYTGILSIISLFGLLFFISQKQVFDGNFEVVSACVIMIVVFGSLLVLFGVLFIFSIVLNIIRYRQGKR